jgi:hypothetical protein
MSRTICAALLALLLGLRLLGATGYMPAFEQGRLSIIVCPSADENAPLAIGVAHHHHGHSKHDHGTCPYAAAASLGALGPGWAPLLGLVFFAVPLSLGRTYAFAVRHTLRARPPSRGPPLPA